MKELVQVITKYLVANPEAIRLQESCSENVSVLELTVPKEEFGRIVGKNGRTADSIRTILNAVGARTRRKVLFEILEATDAGR